MTRRKMQATPTLRRAVEWLALNDNEDIGNAGTGYITSVCFAADMFGVDVERIAYAVLVWRSGKECQI